MKFQRERVHDLIEELLPLLKKHWEEIARFKDIPLAPEFERYMVCEDKGGLRVYTARTDEGLLIGYAAFMIHNNVHYRNSLQALQDVIYIDKERRGFGHMFIAWCDEQLKAEKVQVVSHHVKAKHNWGPMLEKQGYELVDLVFQKRLD